MKVVRAFGGILVGFVMAIVLLIAVELFSAVVHPFPEGVEQTMEEMCAHVARYPQWVLAVAVPIWGVTALVSTWVAGWIGGRAAAIVLGLMLLGSLFWNVSMLPYPMWFKVVSVVVCVAAVFTAIRRTAAGARTGESQPSPVA